MDMWRFVIIIVIIIIIIIIIIITTIILIIIFMVPARRTCPNFYYTFCHHFDPLSAHQVVLDLLFVQKSMLLFAPIKGLCKTEGSL